MRIRTLYCWGMQTTLYNTSVGNWVGTYQNCPVRMPTPILTPFIPSHVSVSRRRWIFVSRDESVTGDHFLVPVYTRSDTQCSHVWLFEGAEGGKWVDEIERLSLEASPVSPDESHATDVPDSSATNSQRSKKARTG